MNQVNKTIEFSALQESIQSCNKRIDTLITQELANRDPQKTSFFKRTFFWKMLLVLAYLFVVQPFITKATVITLDYFFGEKS